LNCAILADDVTPDDEEFDLFIKEVVREMTVKAGQKCTAIRRAIVPSKHLDAVAEKIKARLSKVVVGDPSIEGVKMGALASKSQQADVAERVAMLRQSTELVCGGDAAFNWVGEGVAHGAFFQPTLLLCHCIGQARQGQLGRIIDHQIARIGRASGASLGCQSRSFACARS
jgi:oxepin-CoA hydrolase/3-oxo-5,6-dehydrosuberyl-CoA semialdehyde dehydrogenase